MWVTLYWEWKCHCMAGWVALVWEHRYRNGYNDDDVYRDDSHDDDDDEMSFILTCNDNDDDDCEIWILSNTVILSFRYTRSMVHNYFNFTEGVHCQSPVVINYNQVNVRFTSDGSTVGRGFVLNWSKNSGSLCWPIQLRGIKVHGRSTINNIYYFAFFSISLAAHVVWNGICRKHVDVVI